MEEIIKVENLTHIYETGVEALKGVNIEIHKGEFIALVGQNGSGKSTLVKHFDGLLRPTSGTVTVKGMDISKTRSEKLSSVVGYVFQNPDYMLFALTIEGEVSFGPKNLKLSPDEIKQRVQKALEVTGLEKIKGESPLFFGKGTRRMISIASVLAMDPEVMVIDEPTTGMDYNGRLSVMSLITELNRMGKTIVIITHDMNLVANYCKRVIVLTKGKVVFDGMVEKLFRKAEVLKEAKLKPPQKISLALVLGINDISSSPEEIGEQIAQFLHN